MTNEYNSIMMILKCLLIIYRNHIFEIFNKKLKIDESCEKIDDGIVYILDHKNKTEIYKVYKSGILLYKIHTE